MDLKPRLHRARRVSAIAILALLLLACAPARPATAPLPPSGQSPTTLDGSVIDQMLAPVDALVFGALRLGGTALIVPSRLPSRVDAIAIHGGGDAAGTRERAALSIWQSGRAGMLVAMGGTLPEGDPDGTYAGAVVRRLLSAGAPAGVIVPLEDGLSTATELRALRALAERRGWSSLALCSDSWHSRRVTMEADRVFAGSGIRWYVVAVESAEFELDRWWENPRGREIVPSEWLKLALGWVRAE